MTRVFGNQSVDKGLPDGGPQLWTALCKRGRLSSLATTYHLADNSRDELENRLDDRGRKEKGLERSRGYTHYTLAS